MLKVTFITFDYKNYNISNREKANSSNYLVPYHIIPVGIFFFLYPQYLTETPPYVTMTIQHTGHVTTHYMIHHPFDLYFK
jgi:hypothetical protein